MNVRVDSLYKPKVEKVKIPRTAKIKKQSKLLNKFYDILDKFLTYILLFLIGVLAGFGFCIFIMIM